MPTRIATPTHTTTAPALMDSLSESTHQGVFFLLAVTVYSTIVGQSFTALAGTLDYCKWYLRKSGTIVTGTAYAKVYSHSGVYGTSSLPDALLATSDGFDVSVLTNTPTLYTFNFTGAEKIALSATQYVLTLEFSGGDTTHAVAVGLGSGGHNGNASQNVSGTMTPYPADICFYVYRLTNDHEGAPTRIRPPQYVA